MYSTEQYILYHNFLELKPGIISANRINFFTEKVQKYANHNSRAIQKCLYVTAYVFSA